VVLSQAEMEAVDGDGFFGAIGRAIAGALQQALLMVE